VEERALEEYLRVHIPISSAIGVRVDGSTPDRVALHAPIGPNLNHEDTAFGGSVSALAILAGWSRVHLGLRREGLPARLVIQESRVRYERPIEGDFRAVSDPVDPAAWARFERTLRRRGRSRIRVSVTVFEGDTVAATLTGAYVALGSPPD